jgi:chemotaxis protein MotB
MSGRELPNREVPVRIIYRRRRSHSARHSGAWKVAFADFMTAMFALFLVLWLINQSSDIKSAIAGYFQDPMGRADQYGSSILPGEGAQASIVRPVADHDVMDLRRDRLLTFADQLRKKLDQIPNLEAVKNDIEIDLTDDGLRIQLLEDSTGVFFETGSTQPSERGRAILTLLGGELKALPNRVQLEGHTDSRPYVGHRVYSNWELSTDRANMARRILMESGLPEARIAQVRGYADRQLRDPKDPLAARNRRIAITLLFEPPPPDSSAAAPLHSTAAAPASGPAGPARPTAAAGTTVDAASSPTLPAVPAAATPGTLPEAVGSRTP